MNADAERWANARDEWFDETSSTLDFDPRVVGWGMVGSFGRGEADNWSDLDILVFVADRDFDAFVAPETNGYWSSADRFVDARRNAPAGAASVGALHIRDGLPIGVDWYVYPASRQRGRMIAISGAAPVPHLGPAHRSPSGTAEGRANPRSREQETRAV